ncbi:MAG: S1-like domain-containing RNA-binding protein [Motiliproteus sp.]|nr:S1-like domain-containing RNA-binding protein [Motiliproteus sp.]MCW9052940.1 S1-like domain-containing RNA-binding protein [Motiliproteus sp.]
MAQLGKLNQLTVTKERDFGVYLDGDQLGEILLPKRVVPEGTKVGDQLEVMVYLDSEDLLIATTDKPKTQVGQVDCLKVIATGGVGAFLDWGLPKDLLVPFNEQQQPLKEGDSVIVYTYIDNSNRICASSKLNRYLGKSEPRYKPRQKVDLVIANRTDLGVNAVINNRHWGMIYKDDIFGPLRYGQKISGWIKNVRPDGKINLLHKQPGNSELGDLSAQIVDYLKQHDGFAPLGDKTSSEEITRLFRTSKRKFKMALGGLYKQRVIEIETGGIRLVKQ